MLGQRGGGKFFRHTQNRTGLSAPVEYPNSGPQRAVRVHRTVLQPPAATFSPRLLVSQRVRTPSHQARAEASAPLARELPAPGSGHCGTALRTRACRRRFFKKTMIQDLSNQSVHELGAAPYCLFPLPIVGKGVRGLGRRANQLGSSLVLRHEKARASGLFSCRRKKTWKASALRPIPLAPSPARERGNGPENRQPLVSGTDSDSDQPRCPIFIPRGGSQTHEQLPQRRTKKLAEPQ